MTIPTVQELEAAFRARSWSVFRDGRLNIVILRRTPGVLDAFDDMLVVLYWHPKGWRLFACRCTADPGKPSRAKPRRRDGTAVWAECQLVDGFAIGKHHGEYDCLVPVVPVPVLRYTGLEDEVGDPSTSNATQIHRASATKESTAVGPWSEGCCVVANPADFARLMDLAVVQRHNGKARFTVSLMGWS